MGARRQGQWDGGAGISPRRRTGRKLRRSRAAGTQHAEGESKWKKKKKEKKKEKKKRKKKFPLISRKLLWVSRSPWVRDLIV